MLPLIPVAVASGSSLLAAVGGWAFVKYEQMNDQLKRVADQAAQLERSADVARTGTLWGELLEPLAKRWGGALKLMAYAIVAASAALIVVGLGAWAEIRRLRYDQRQNLEAEIRRLQDENARLRKG